MGLLSNKKAKRTPLRSKSPVKPAAVNHVKSSPMSEAHKNLLLRFAMIAPVLVFVDQALAHSGVSSFQRTVYQLMCIGALYLIIGPSSSSKMKQHTAQPNPELLAKRGRGNLIIAGNSGVFWKNLPGEKTIPAPQTQTGMLENGQKVVYGETPVDPAVVRVPKSVLDSAAGSVTGSSAGSSIKTVETDIKSNKAGSTKSAATRPSSSSAQSLKTTAQITSPDAIIIPERAASFAIAATVLSSSAAPTTQPPKSSKSPSPKRPIPPTPPSPELRPTKPARVVSDVSHVSTSGLPIKYEKEIEMMVKTLMHLAKESTQWKVVSSSDTPKHRLSVHGSIDEGWKFELDVDSTLDSAFQFLVDPKTRLQWDEMTESCRVLATYTTSQNEITRVQYHRTKGLFPATPRDMIVLFHARKMGTDRVVIVQRSVDWDLDKIKDEGEGLRADVNIAGSVIERVRAVNGKPRVRITHVHDVNYHLDVQLSLSDFMITMIAPRTVKRLAAGIEAYKASRQGIPTINVETSTDEEGERPKKRWSPPPRISLPDMPAFEDMVSPLVLPSPAEVASPISPKSMDTTIIYDIPPSPHRYAQDVEDIISDVLAQVDASDKGWRSVCREGQTQVFVNEAVDGAFRFKVVAEMQGKIDIVFETLVSLAIRPSWDPSCTSTRLIEKLDNSTFIHQVIMSSDKPNTPPKESVVLSHTRSLSSSNGLVGILWSVGKANTNEGELSGVICEPHPRSADKCILTHLLSSPITASEDGSANSVMRYVASKTLPAAVKRLQEVVLERERKGKGKAVVGR